MDLFLKNCPACGGRAQFYANREGVAVVCTECAIRTLSYHDWNHDSDRDGLDQWREGDTAVRRAADVWNYRKVDGSND